MPCANCLSKPPGFLEIQSKGMSLDAASVPFIDYTYDYYTAAEPPKLALLSKFLKQLSIPQPYSQVTAALQHDL